MAYTNTIMLQVILQIHKSSSIKLNSNLYVRKLSKFLLLCTPNCNKNVFLADTYYVDGGLKMVTLVSTWRYNPEDQQTSSLLNFKFNFCYGVLLG